MHKLAWWWKPRVVEAAPAAALVGPEPQFRLELLVVALDAPSELGKFDQAREADLLGQRREPVLGGLLLAFRPLDQEPFLRARLIQPVIAMSGSHPHPCKTRGEPVGYALAPTDLGPCLWPRASAFTEVGWCSLSRRISLGGRPRPDQGLGARPCAQAEVFDRYRR